MYNFPPPGYHLRIFGKIFFYLPDDIPSIAQIIPKWATGLGWLDQYSANSK